MNTTRYFVGFIVQLLVSKLLSCTNHRISVVTPGVNRLPRITTIGGSVSKILRYDYEPY